LRATHQHLVVDVSEATDQTAALAFGVADLTLIPLRPSNIDIAVVAKTLELLEILSNHRRRSLSRAVFLVNDPVTLSPSIHLQISGLLIRRGLRTLPVCLSERSAADYLASQQEDCVLSDTADQDFAATAQFELNAFVECVLENLSENSLSANRVM
jgi:cellulose biosynthesis protein BcsQ